VKPEELPNQSETERPEFGQGSDQQHIPEIQDDRLAESLEAIERGYDPSARFETQLMLESLLSRLEQAGIVPVVDNPNPHNPDLDEEQHEQWWEEHPQEAMKFEESVDKRNEVLRHLFIGALIGSGPWNIP